MTYPLLDSAAIAPRMLSENRDIRAIARVLSSVIVVLGIIAYRYTGVRIAIPARIFIPLFSSLVRLVR